MSNLYMGAGAPTTAIQKNGKIFLELGYQNASDVDESVQDGVYYIDTFAQGTEIGNNSVNVTTRDGFKNLSTTAYPYDLQYSSQFRYFETFTNSSFANNWTQQSGTWTLTSGTFQTIVTPGSTNVLSLNQSLSPKIEFQFGINYPGITYDMGPWGDAGIVNNYSSTNSNETFGMSYVADIGVAQSIIDATVPGNTNVQISSQNSPYQFQIYFDGLLAMCVLGGTKYYSNIENENTLVYNLSGSTTNNIALVASLPSYAPTDSTVQFSNIMIYDLYQFYTTDSTIKDIAQKCGINYINTPSDFSDNFTNLNNWQLG